MSIHKANKYEMDQIISYSMDVLKESTMGAIQTSPAKSYEMIKSFLRDGGYYLVKVDNFEIKGWIAVGSHIDYYHNERVGMIPELYVLPKFRKQGIAAQLCLEAFKHLEEFGFTRVQLNVFTGNKAEYFYQKLGFRKVSSLMTRNL